MIWETPVIQEIACGMEVTAYAGADEGRDEAGEPTLREPDGRDG